MRCPSCGSEMEEGFLGIEVSPLTPPKWFRKKSLTGLGGETIATGWTFSGLKYLEAYRCPQCRNITIRY